MLTIYKDDSQNLMLMQNNWARQINPILANPNNNSLILKNISLVAGSNTINHLLGRKLQGWKVIRQRAQASIYDNQDANQQPDLTLTLISDNPVVIDLEVL